MRTFKYISFFLLFSICWITSAEWTEGYAQTSKSQTRQPAKSNIPKTPSTKKQQSQKKEESVNTLKDRQTKVKNEIKKIDESISKTQLTTKQTLKEIERLSEDIASRNAIIAQQTKEIAELDRKIAIMDEELRKMELEYNLTKQKYVNLIYRAYVKNNSHSRLLFIMSAPSFQESYRRLYYLQQFAAFRKQQAEEIETSRVKLVAKEEEIRKAKLLSEKRLEQREKEQKQLLIEKEKQDDLIASLQKRETDLKKALQEQQKIADQLNKRIEELVAKEIEDERKRQAEAAKKSGQAMTQEEKTISGGFENNKGKLMPPVRGKITGRFGVQPHPAHKDITINNKGIYITAPRGSEAASVYDGTVTQCFSIPGNNNAVIVRHGDYLTVYANLTNIYVKSGDKVAKGGKIGKIYEDAEDDNRAVLFFQVWKEKDLQNPEFWIQK